VHLLGSLVGHLHFFLLMHGTFLADGLSSLVDI